MVELHNKKILIMGASGGIGSKTAIKLSQLGAKVVISGRNSDSLRNVFSQLEGNGHFYIPFDIEELDKTMDFMKSVLEVDNKKLSGLVYCTGIFPIRPIKNTHYDFLHHVMSVNFFGFVEMVRCFSNRKFSDSGSIVALSSYASINGDKGQLDYSASKGAIDSSIVVMAKELYAKEIRINAIRPANVAYDNMKDDDDLPDGTKAVTEKMQTGFIDPNNIAEHIAFLLSDYSSGVYGRCFDVRGYLS